MRRLATGPHGVALMGGVELCAQILHLGRRIVTRGDGPDQLHLKGVMDSPPTPPYQGRDAGACASS
jgi:hypothetical protein